MSEKLINEINMRTGMRYRTRRMKYSFSIAVPLDKLNASLQ
ncbi:hypothetical protein [Methanosarcina sp. UBA411]|nr:hypothetical protein [Methanosarcina sp. UBA411]